MSMSLGTLEQVKYFLSNSPLILIKILDFSVEELYIRPIVNQNKVLITFETSLYIIYCIYFIGNNFHTLYADHRETSIFKHFTLVDRNLEMIFYFFLNPKHIHTKFSFLVIPYKFTHFAALWYTVQSLDKQIHSLAKR